MRRMLGGVAVTGLLCVGCSGGEDTVEITTTDSAGQPTVITQEVTQAPEEPAGDVRPAPTLAPLEPTSVSAPGGATVAFAMPADWTLEQLGPTSLVEPQPGSVAPHRWCLVPPADLPAIDDCAGLLLASGPDWLPGGAGAPYAPRQVDGWLSTPGRLLCPVDKEGDLRTDEALVTATPDGVGQTGAPEGGGLDASLPGVDEEPVDGAEEGAAAAGEEDGEAPEEPAGDPGDEAEPDLASSESDGRPLTSVRTEVDGREVHYETWRVTCTLSEFSFTPQLWHDPELDVLVKDYFGRPETALIVDSLGSG